MKKVLFIALLSVVQVNLFAQAKDVPAEPRMEPKEFQHRIRQELTRVAGFTQEEEEKFFSLYTEMRDKQRQVGRQIHALKKEQPQSAKEYSSTIARIKQLQVEMSKVEQSYYKRILAAIPAEKVWLVMKAEDEFHRRMVRGKRQKPQPQPLQPQR